MSRTGALVVAAACAVACSAAPRATPSDVAAATGPAAVGLAPGIVASGDRSTLFLMAPAGGVEARATASGELLWASLAAARPLALAAGRLLAQTEPAAGHAGLGLVVLDPATGEPATEPFAVALPDGVRPAIDHSLEEAFALTPSVHGDEVWLEWSYLLQPDTGVSPPPGGTSPARRERGVVRVDPRRGTAVAETAAALPHEPRPAALLDALERAGDAARAIRVGGLWVAIGAERRAGGTLRLTLWRWRDPGAEPLSERVIFEGRAAAHLPSADGRHLMVASPPDEPAAGGGYRWHLLSLETGDPVASVAAGRSVTPFLVAGGRLVHLAEPAGRRVDGRWVEAPLRLRVVDLASERELWAQPVRDPAFRGPRPPRPGASTGASTPRPIATSGRSR